MNRTKDESTESDTSRDNSSTGMPKPHTSSDKKMQKYLEIIQLVADNEIRYVRSFNMDLDIEELYSIGILAVQVLKKNKTPEQLAQYNPVYLATAISLTIRNELRIRYKAYSIASPVLDLHADDEKAKVRMTIYFGIKELYYNPGVQTDSEAIRLITEIMDGINNAKAYMTDSELECAKFFFDKNSTPQEINSRFSTAEIIAMFDAVKRICNDNNIIQLY